MEFMLFFLQLKLPEDIRSPLLKDGLGVVVYEVLWVEDVEEVELGEHGDRGLLPGLERLSTLAHYQLLNTKQLINQSINIIHGSITNHHHKF